MKTLGFILLILTVPMLVSRMQKERYTEVDVAFAANEWTTITWGLALILAGVFNKK